MEDKNSRIMDVAADNAPVPGCTISRQMIEHGEGRASVFSLAAGTGISAESYSRHKLLTVYSGSMEVYTADGRSSQMAAGDSLITEKDVPVGMRSGEGCIYTETEFGKETAMNEILKAGKVFELKDLVPYQEGRIVNMDLISDPDMKFVIMSFDEGTGLSEHAAPGEALVFALDGKAVIRYEGVDYPIRAGETFKFDKMGRHAVTADGRFKMALLLVLK